MSGIKMQDDGKNAIKLTQQRSVGDVHMALLELPNGNLVKVTVVGVKAKAEMLNSAGERIYS